MDMATTLVSWPRLLEQSFVQVSNPLKFYMKFDFHGPSSFAAENVWKNKSE